MKKKAIRSTKLTNMEEILKDQMQQALDNYCRTYRAYTEEDKFTFLLGYQAAINVAKAAKVYTDKEVCKIYIKLIEARGDYHMAGDIGDIESAIYEYNKTKK